MRIGMGSRLLCVAAAGLALMSGGGCSMYHRDARRVSAGTATAASTAVEGLWIGRWHDEKRPSHGGELRCVFTRTGHQVYRLSSRSRWWGWFTSALDATVVVTPVGPGRFEIRGGRGIGPFGDYTVEARIDGDRLGGVYRAAGHTGRIELERRPAGDRG